MKRTTEIYAHNEHVNENGVKIVDTVYCETDTLSSGAVYKTRYSWVHEIGDHKMLWYETTQLARMKKEMEKGGFYN